MVKLGDYAVNIGGFVDLGELIIGEAAKYLFLLLFSILAIRLWRRWPKVPAQNRRGNLIFAVCSTVIACVIGYFSICHSMSRLYGYYGMRAFKSDYLLSALSLFGKSGHYWKSADALGNQGICLLWLGHPDVGERLLQEAKQMRHGKNPAFEDFYEGLYYYFHDQTGKAIPLLESASTDETYHWTVVKLFAVLQLDANQPQEAEKLMEPFKQVEVTEADHAYVAASLALAEGKTAEARTLWQKFTSTNLPSFWRTRFDKLDLKINNKTN
jgi:hypothetical protein